MEDKIGKLIGSGGTSDVYEWGDSEVIKIYKSHINDYVINHERNIGVLLNEYSLNIPKCIGLIDYNGDRAIIYERIKGKVMAETVLEEEFSIETAKSFAQMHYDIHKNEIRELPSQYDFLRNRILELKNILGEEYPTLLKLLDTIPIENKLCHGDYQPMNVIGDANKYIVIDWNGACSGNPILDVAWSYMTLNSPYIGYLLGDRFDIITDFSEHYLTSYCELSGIKKVHILNYLPIVAARRLYDNNGCDNEISSQEREWLLKFIRMEAVL
jgi:tRNA A-37 threonylcarbamoyl transferase component Bud32